MAEDKGILGGGMELPDRKNGFIPKTNVGRVRIENDYDIGIRPDISQSIYRSSKQGGGQAFLNAAARVIPKAYNMMLGNVGAMLDFEDYYNQDNEVGNKILTEVAKWNEAVDNAFPIYGGDETLDVGNSKWWSKNLGGVAESALAFVATSYLTGGLMGWGLQAVGATGKVGQIINVGTTALAMNQAESMQSASQVYRDSYQLNLQKGMDPEEAKQRAADAAAYVVNLNRLNLPLNLTSIGMIVKSRAGYLTMANEVTRRNTLKAMAREGAQEYAEEVINKWAEDSGTAKNVTGKGNASFGSLLSTLLSEEGVEAGILGAIGGVGQTGLTIGTNSALGRYKEQEQRWGQSQAYLSELERMSNTAGLPQLKEIIDNAEVQTKLLRQLDEAERGGNTQEAEAIRNTMLQHHAFEAFKTGTTDKLLEKLKMAAKEQDGDTPGAYASKLADITKRVHEWGKMYDNRVAPHVEARRQPLFENLLDNARLKQAINQKNNEIVNQQTLLQGQSLLTQADKDAETQLRGEASELYKMLADNDKQYKYIMSEKFLTDVKEGRNIRANYAAAGEEAESVQEAQERTEQEATAKQNEGALAKLKKEEEEAKKQQAEAEAKITKATTTAEKQEAEALKKEAEEKQKKAQEAQGNRNLIGKMFKTKSGSIFEIMDIQPVPDQHGVPEDIVTYKKDGKTKYLELAQFLQNMDKLTDITGTDEDPRKTKSPKQAAKEGEEKSKGKTLAELKESGALEESVEELDERDTIEIEDSYDVQREEDIYQPDQFRFEKTVGGDGLRLRYVEVEDKDTIGPDGRLLPNPKNEVDMDALRDFLATSNEATVVPQFFRYGTGMTFIPLTYAEAKEHYKTDEEIVKKGLALQVMHNGKRIGSLPTNMSQELKQTAFTNYKADSNYSFKITVSEKKIGVVNNIFKPELAGSSAKGTTFKDRSYTTRLNEVSDNPVIVGGKHDMTESGARTNARFTPLSAALKKLYPGEWLNRVVNKSSLRPGAVYTVIDTGLRDAAGQAKLFFARGIPAKTLDLNEAKYVAGELKKIIMLPKGSTKLQREARQRINHIVYFKSAKKGDKSYQAYGNSVGISFTQKQIWVGKTAYPLDVADDVLVTALMNLHRTVDLSMTNRPTKTYTDPASGKKYPNGYTQFLNDEGVLMFNVAPKTEPQFLQNTVLFNEPKVELTELALETEHAASTSTPSEEVKEAPVVEETKAPVEEPKPIQEEVKKEAQAAVKKGVRPKKKTRLAKQDKGKIFDAATEIAWLKRVFGRNANYEIKEGVLRVAGKQAWGYFSDAMITLSDIAAEGTTYHEAFHQVFTLYLSDSQQNHIIQQYRDKYKLDSLTDGQIEERLAEAFREHVQWNGNLSQGLSSINKFFSNLWFLIKSRVFQRFSYTDVFKAINTEYYRNAKPKKGRRVELVKTKLIDGLTDIEQYELIDAVVGGYLTVYNEHKSSAKGNEIHRNIETVFDSTVEMLSAELQDDNRIAIITDPDNRQILLEKAKQLVKAKFGIRFKDNIGLPSEIDELINEDGTDELVENAEKAAEQEGGYQFNFASQSVYDKASQKLKQMVATLYKPDPDAVAENDRDTDTNFYWAETNSWGLPTYVDFDTTWNYLVRNLSNIFDKNEMFDEINRLSAFKPELDQLYQMLDSDRNSLIATQFFTIFNTVKLPYSLIRYTPTNHEGLTADEYRREGKKKGQWKQDGTRYELIASDRTSIDVQLVGKWNLAMENIAVSKKAGSVFEMTDAGISIKPDIATILMKKYEEILATYAVKKSDPNYDFVEVSEGVSDILASIGIKMDSIAFLTELEENGPEGLDAYIMPGDKGVYRIMSSISKGTFFTEGESSSMRMLARLQGRFEQDLVENSFRNFEGNTVYSYNIAYPMNKFMDRLTADEKFEAAIEEMRKDPINKDSYILELIENDEKFRKDKFKFIVLDGLKENKVKSRGVNYGNFTRTQLEIAKLSMFLNTNGESYTNTDYGINNERLGMYSVHTPSDSSTLGFISMPVLNKAEGLRQMFKLHEQEQGRIQDARNLISAAKAGKLTREELDSLVDTYHYKYSDKLDGNGNPVYPDFKNYDGAQALKHNEFKEFGDKALFDKFFEGKFSYETYLENKLNEEWMTPLLDAWVTKKAREYNRYLKTEGIQEGSATVDNKAVKDRFGDFGTMVYSYTMNSFIVNAELQKIATGNMAYWGDEAKFNKRAKLILSPYRSLDQTHTGETYKLGIAEDVEVSTMQDVKAAIQRINDTVLKDKSKKLDTSIGDLYKSGDINVADAQGFITLSEAIKVLKGLGKYYSNFDAKGRKAYNKTLTQLEMIQRGEATDLDAGIILQPLKSIAVGFNLQTVPQFDEAGNRVGDSAVNAIEFLKNSQVVLIPALTKGTALDQLRVWMETNDVGHFVMKSGHKGGSRGTKPLTEVHVDVQKGVEKLVNFDFLDGIAPVTKKYSDYGIQLEIPEHHLDAQNKLGVQVAKLVLEGIPDTEDGNEYMMSNGKSAAQTKQDYLSLLSINIDESFKELQNEIKNDENIRRMIMDSLGEVSDNIEQLFDLHIDSETGLPVFKHQLWMNVEFARKIESLLNALFKNNVVRQKMNGGSFIQVSALGFNDKRSTKKSFNLLSENEKRGIEWVKSKRDNQDFNLNFYDTKKTQDGVEVSRIQILLPATSRDFFREGIQIGIDELPNELRNMIAYRIPTQGKNSILAVEVVGFLPKESGSSIILPEEITKLTGSDFDIDKMYVMTPNHRRTATGKIVMEKYYEDAGEHYKDKYLRKIYLLSKLDAILSGDREAVRSAQSNLDNFKDAPIPSNWKDGFADLPLQEEGSMADQILKSEGYSVKKYNELVKEIRKAPSFEEFSSTPAPLRNTRKARENQIQKTIADILLEPKLFEDIIRPLDGTDYRGVADFISSITGVGSKYDSFNLPLTQSKMAIINQVGIKLTGIHANANANRPIAQEIKLQLTGNNNFKILFNNWKPSQSFYDLYDRTGKPIASYISQLLSASVDNAKELIHGLVNSNLWTSNVIVTLLENGIPIQTVFNFVNQPSVVRAYEKVERSKGTENEFNDHVYDTISDYVKASEPDVNELQVKERVTNILNDSEVYNLNDEDMVFYMLASQYIDSIEGELLDKVNYDYTLDGLLDYVNSEREGALKNIQNLYPNFNFDNYNFKTLFSDYVEYQLKVLQNYNNYKKASEERALIIRTQKIDVYDGDSSSSIDKLEQDNRKLEELKVPDRLGKKRNYFEYDESKWTPIRYLKKALYDTVDRSGVSKFGLQPGEMSAKMLLSKYIPFGSNAFTWAKAELGELVARPNEFSKDTLDAINYELLSMALSGFGNHRNPIFRNLPVQYWIKNLTYGESTLAHRLQLIKEDTTINTNMFIQQLEPQIGKEDQPSSIIFASGRRSPITVNRIITAFEELVSSDNEFIKEFALDMIIYSYINKGFQFGNNSFFSYISHDRVLTKEGLFGENTMSYSDFVNNINKEFSNDIFKGYALRQLIANNIFTSGFMKTYRDLHQFTEQEISDRGARLEEGEIAFDSTKKDELKVKDGREVVHYIKVYDEKQDEIKAYALKRIAGDNDDVYVYRPFLPLGKSRTRWSESIKEYDMLNGIEKSVVNDDDFRNKYEVPGGMRVKKATNPYAPINIWYGTNENQGLSNLAYRPFEDKDGRKYISVEHAYQSWKSGHFDEETYNKYKTPGIKIQGKRGTYTKDNWNVNMMKTMLRSSFQQNPVAMDALLATGNSPLTHTQDTGVWKTEFPRLLMELRAEFRGEDGEKAQPKEIGVDWNPDTGNLVFTNIDMSPFKFTILEGPTENGTEWKVTYSSFDGKYYSRNHISNGPTPQDAALGARDVIKKLYEKKEGDIQEVHKSIMKNLGMDPAAYRVEGLTEDEQSLVDSMEPWQQEVFYNFGKFYPTFTTFTNEEKITFILEQDKGNLDITCRF